MSRKFRVTLEIEMADSQEPRDAGSWAASVIELLKPKCKACRGEGRLRDPAGFSMHNSTCSVCDGRGRDAEHVYKPRVVQVTEVPPLSKRSPP